MKIIRLDKQSDWTNITRQEIVDMLYQIVNRHGNVCIAIKSGDQEQKIVKLNRIFYIYTSIKIHFAAKKIFKLLATKENDNVDGS